MDGWFYFTFGHARLSEDLEFGFWANGREGGKGKGGGNEMRDGRKRGGKLGGDAAETRVVFVVSDVFGSWGRGWRSRYYGMSKRV